MKKFVKTLLGLSVGQALFMNASNAATYVVEEIAPDVNYKYSYGQSGNNAGQFVFSVEESYNFPIQYQFLDEDDFDAIENYAEANHDLLTDQLEPIEDPEALRAGNPTANDLEWTILWMQNFTANNPFYQKIVDTSAMINRSGESVEFFPFDVFIDEINSYSRSTFTYINAINENGWIFGNGSAPYLPIPFVESDGDEVEYWVRGFDSHGYFYQEDLTNSIQITPPETTYGGESGIFGANGNIAVGYASVSVEPEVLKDIEEDFGDGGCFSEAELEDQPADYCVSLFKGALYNVEAYKWFINDDGSIDASQSSPLGLLITPNDDDDRNYASYAQDINANGIAVGYSHGWIENNETTPGANESRAFYAVAYIDGEVVDLNTDHEEYFDSRTYDINDQNIAVGHVNFFNEGTVRQKFFYVDASAEQPQMIMPDGFFTGSSSFAYSINENGKIVGKAQVENHDDAGGNRRTGGILYDTNSEVLVDVNDLLSCDQQKVYDVLEARHIDESDTIYGTAVTKAPILDAKGEPYFDENGEPLLEDVVTAVKLTSITGEIESCEKELEENIERSGASFGWLSLLLLLPLRIFRK